MSKCSPPSQYIKGSPEVNKVPGISAGQAVLRTNITKEVPPVLAKLSVEKRNRIFFAQSFIYSRDGTPQKHGFRSLSRKQRPRNPVTCRLT